MQLNPFKKKPASVDAIMATFTATMNELDSFEASQASLAQELQGGAAELRSQAEIQEAEADAARAEGLRAKAIRLKLAALVSE